MPICIFGNKTSNTHTHTHNVCKDDKQHCEPATFLLLPLMAVYCVLVYVHLSLCNAHIAKMNMHKGYSDTARAFRFLCRMRPKDSQRVVHMSIALNCLCSVNGKQILLHTKRMKWKERECSTSQSRAMCVSIHALTLINVTGYAYYIETLFFHFILFRIWLCAGSVVVVVACCLLCRASFKCIHFVLFRICELFRTR